MLNQNKCEMFVVFYYYSHFMLSTAVILLPLWSSLQGRKIDVFFHNVLDFAQSTQLRHYVH